MVNPHNFSIGKSFKITLKVDAVKIIEEKLKNLKNPQEFNKTLNSFDISKKVLNFAREKYRVFLVESKENMKKPLNRKKAENLSVKCNKQWPICAFVIENLKILKPEMEFFVFKQGFLNDLLIHEDYFQFTEDFEARKKKIPFRNMKENLVIGRYEHFCDKIQENEERKLEKITMISIDNSGKKGGFTNNFKGKNSIL